MITVGSGKPAASKKQNKNGDARQANPVTRYLWFFNPLGGRRRSGDAYKL